VPAHLILSSCTLATDLLEPEDHLSGGDGRHVRYRTPEARQSNESQHRNMFRNQYRAAPAAPSLNHKNRRQMWQAQMTTAT
jgi:hypothetical protein